MLSNIMKELKEVKAAMSKKKVGELEKLKDIEIAGSQYANRAAILTEEYLG